MYKELIKELRDKAEFLRKADRNGVYNSFSETMNKAAYVIEDLDMKLQGSNAAVAGMRREIERMVIDSVNNKQQWILVTDKEQLPNTDQGVVGYFACGAFNQFRWYDFVRTLSDGTIVGENTERDVINEHCIAVYKLPEPPEEDL